MPFLLLSRMFCRLGYPIRKEGSGSPQNRGSTTPNLSSIACRFLDNSQAASKPVWSWVIPSMYRPSASKWTSFSPSRASLLGEFISSLVFLDPYLCPWPILISSTCFWPTLYSWKSDVSQNDHNYVSRYESSVWDRYWPWSCWSSPPGRREPVLRMGRPPYICPNGRNIVNHTCTLSHDDPPRYVHWSLVNIYISENSVNHRQLTGNAVFYN